MPVSFTDEELKGGLQDLGYEPVEPVSFSQSDVTPTYQVESPRQQPSNWNTVGAFTQGTKEGVVGLLGAPVDITNSLLGLPFGRTGGFVQQPTGGSQSILNALQATGLQDYPVQPNIPSNIAQLAGRQVPSLVIPAVGAAKAGVTPLKAVATTIPSEAGAAVAGGTIKTLYPENQAAELIATIGGGFATAGAQTLAKNWVNPNINIRVNRTLNAVAPLDRSDIGLMDAKSILEAEQRGIDGVKAITVSNKQEPFVYRDLEGRVVRKGLPETRFEFAEAVDQMKARTYTQYNKQQQAAGQKGLMFSGDNINNRLSSYLADPEAPPSASLEHSYLKKNMKLYEGKQFTPAQMEKELALVNARLKAYYKNPAPNQANRASADIKLAEILRNELDSGITAFEGPGYQQFRNQYSNIRSLQDRIGRAAQKQLKEESTPQKWYDIKDVGIGVGTALSMTQDPWYALVGATLLGSRQAGRYLMQPDRRIKTMFKASDQLFKPTQKWGPLPDQEATFVMKPHEGEVINEMGIVPTGRTRQQTVDGQYTNARINPSQQALPWNPRLNPGAGKPGVVTHPGITAQQAAPFDFNSALQDLVSNGYSPVEARDMLIRQIKSELQRRNR